MSCIYFFFGCFFFIHLKPASSVCHAVAQLVPARQLMARRRRRSVEAKRRTLVISAHKFTYDALALSRAVKTPS